MKNLFFASFLSFISFSFGDEVTGALSNLMIDVDDDVEVAVVLGGWNIERPVLIRSDGRPCQNSQELPKFPQGPFVDGAAVYVPKEGIVLCGGLVGTRADHSSTNKCYFMDHTRTVAQKFNLMFIEMEGSEVPVSFENSTSDGLMSMVASDLKAGLEATRLYLYVNKTNQIFVGNLLPNLDCDYSVDIERQCSRIKILWTQLSQTVGLKNAENKNAEKN